MTNDISINKDAAGMAAGGIRDKKRKIVKKK